MSCLSHASYGAAAIFSNTCRLLVGTSRYGRFGSNSSVRVNFVNPATFAIKLDSPLFTRFCVQSYSTAKRSKSKTGSRKAKAEPEMEQDKDAFFVVRKGDVVGVYKTLGECQAQIGTSIFDPPTSVFKGHGLSKDTEEYLSSCGLKNALYTIRATDLKDVLFGSLVPCTFHDAASSKGEASPMDNTKKRSLEELKSETVRTVVSERFSEDTWAKHVKLDDSSVVQPSSSSSQSCIIEFDGASKGNPGRAGAGAVLRSPDGRLICRLRQGLGTATCNIAEYQAILLGLKYALKNGFTEIQARGDSKLVCMQLNGLWKVKNENISYLWEEVNKLKKRFLSFRISHVLREFNSEADAQANLGVALAEGQVQEELAR